ncbi:SurA N-terminal domain-containing protein [Sphingomonas sp. WKB10]|nr:SurA N-terminal domain-containing protein [Sphingomonas sp. WKB10]
MTHNIRRNLRGKAVRLLGWTALAAFSTGAIAQTVADQQVPDTNLNIPANLQIFGKLDPNVRKPTAIVNDTVITGTDVDQRLALTVFNNGGRTPSPDQIDEFKLQILRQLIDETLEIQEAKSAEITVTQAELDQSEAGLAKGST